MVNVPIFAHRRFLPPQDCARLRAEASSARGLQAKVADGTVISVDQTVRRSKIKLLSPDALRLISSRFETVRPTVEQRFGLRWGSFSEPQVLAYSPGDFFSKHSDWSPNPEAAPEVRSRTLSAVVFLDGERRGSDAQGFAGGRLTLYDDHEGDKLEIIGEEGLLVVFPSETIHEVTTVTAGVRLTAVSWYCSP